MNSALERLASDIKGSGAVWTTKAFFGKLLDAIIADRARLSQSSGQELPSPDGKGRWFIVNPGGSTGTTTTFFRLVAADERDGSGNVTANNVRVMTSTLAGDVPDDFEPGDDPPFLLGVSDGDVIYGHVTIDTTDGSITSRTIEAGASLPASNQSTGEYYERIGSVAFDDDGATVPSNDRYGPIQTDIFRDWFQPVVRFILVWL